MRGISRHVVAIALLLAWSASMSMADGDRRPNVVVILADDLGYADVGFQGCKDIPTPRIDALARAGVRCASGYVSHPFCSPTRAGLLTGRYQQRFGHENNPTYDPDDVTLGLPADQVTMADVLGKAGYVTGAVGKWHLGAAPRFHPGRRGFADFFGFLGGGHVYLPDAKGGLEYTIPIRHDGEPVPWGGGDYLTDFLSRAAADFIDRNAKRPFLLYLAYNAPHTPLQATAAGLERFRSIDDPKRRPYAAMVASMDEGIGRVLDALKANDLDDDTIVFFLSDNGGPPTANGSDNAPLRGAKGSVFEGGIRVPFVVRWTGHLDPGSTFAEPVCSIDIFPTAAAVAGADLPEGLRLDGVDLLPYLSGMAQGPPHDRLFWRTGGGEHWAVREGRYKLLDQGPGGPELYDLEADIGETRGLASAQPDRVAAMRQDYSNWNEDLIPPLWQSPKRPAPAKAKDKAATSNAGSNAY